MLTNLTFAGTGCLAGVASTVLFNKRAKDNAITQQAEKENAPRTKTASLGIIRLDYNYPPALGDIDCPESYKYDVHYRVVPGLTFQMCMDNTLTDEVKVSFKAKVKELEDLGVCGITGDCGFMMWLQPLARQTTKIPVFMSSLVMAPMLKSAYTKHNTIMIVTADSRTLDPMHQFIAKESGTRAEHFHIIGCQNVPGFEAVALGGKVPLEEVTPGIVALVKQVIAEKANTPFPIDAILLECTELPPYANALRLHTGLPVWDPIIGANFFTSGCRSNPRFGMHWMHTTSAAERRRLHLHNFGEHLTSEEKLRMVTKFDTEDKDEEPSWKLPVKSKHLSSGKMLGVIRLHYNCLPAIAPGDMLHPGSFKTTDVIYKAVKGLTYDMCASGHLTDEVEEEFVKAIRYLHDAGVSGITGGCGFMYFFQTLARRHTDKPVFMSALMQLPSLTACFGHLQRDSNRHTNEKIAIFTRDAADCSRMMPHILSQCHGDVTEERFTIVSCRDVPHFSEFAQGKGGHDTTHVKVHVAKVTPHILAHVKEFLEKNPQTVALLLEETELAPYSDAIRDAFGLPVFDVITLCDAFMDGFLQNPHCASALESPA